MNGGVHIYYICRYTISQWCDNDDTDDDGDAENLRIIARSHHNQNEKVCSRTS